MKSKDSIRRRQSLRLQLLGSIMMLTLIGCCHKPKPKEPEVIVVDPNEVIENSDGTYTVSKGWMLHRMDLEQKLGEALHMCIGEEQ